MKVVCRKLVYAAFTP
ncbi:hypothetical protein K6U61_00400 [Vibrio vulnificus]|nr:hypothetical protein [Vibrio vulnificus]